MSTGNQHQRKRFHVPASNEDADQSEMRKACEASSCIPSGPARARVCLRCGTSIRPPSLEEVSKMMGAAQTITQLSRALREAIPSE